MQTQTAPSASLPFELGEPRSFAGLTIVPLYPTASPHVDYVGLDEAAASGLTVTEVDEAGAVETLLVTNTLGTAVLLYEGEELIGAKQNRILERSILVAAGSKLEIPAKCVEQGRWAYRSQRFAPAPRAAHPELRRLSARPRRRRSRRSLGRGRREVGAARRALGRRAPPRRCTSSSGASLDEYLQALPRLDGQAGAIVGIAGGSSASTTSAARTSSPAST